METRGVVVRTSHIQTASNQFLGGGSSSLFSWHQSKRRQRKKDVRYRIKFGYIGDKVHFAWTDPTYAHDEPGAYVKHREQHDG